MLCYKDEAIGIQRFKLKEEVPCGDKVREELNEWLKDFFGENQVHRITGKPVIIMEDIEELGNNDVLNLFKIARMFGGSLL